MAIVKLTQGYLSNIERPASGTLRVMDAEVRGLCADIGTKSIRFYLRRQFFGSTKPIKLGEFPAMTVSQARDAANKCIAQAASGKNVTDTVAATKQAPTLQAALDEYISFRSSTGCKLKPSTIADMRQRMSHLLGEWGDTRITQITRRMVSDRHKAITEGSGPSAANGAMRYLSAVLNWSAEHYAPDDDSPLLTDNPVKVLSSKRQWNTESRRQSFVAADKLPALWAALQAIATEAEHQPLQAEVVRDYFLFCLMTGMRPGEARRINVGMVDLKKRSFVLRDSKNGTDFHLPFSAFVAELLTRRVIHATNIDSEYVFPALGYFRNAETLNLRFWTTFVSGRIGGFMPQDMRRTFATAVSNLNDPVAHSVLKRLMNHKTIVSDARDVTAGYIGTDVERLRPVVERITQEILRMCGQKPKAKVVQIRA